MDYVWKLGEGSMQRGVEVLASNDSGLGGVGEKCTGVQAEQKKNRIRRQPADLVHVVDRGADDGPDLDRGGRHRSAWEVTRRRPDAPEGTVRMAA